MDVIPNGKYKEFLIPIDILSSLQNGKFGDKEVHNIETSLSTTCLDQSHEDSDVELDFTFEYDIHARAEFDDKEYILSSKTASKFKHKYQIEGGPAPTNKLVPFSIYVPKILNASLDDIKIQPAELTNNCTRLALGSSRTGYERMTIEGSPKFCNGDEEDNSKCDVFQCELKTGFGIGDARKLRVTMNLGLAPDKTESFTGGKFSLATALRFKDDPNFEMARSSFIYQEFSVGKILEYWPIGVGILISLLIFITIVFIMYKKNVFSKLRFARKAMEAKDEQAQGQQGVEEQKALISQ